MPAALTAKVIVFTGTGTGIGKTFLAVATVRAWGRSAKVVGYKPIESGVRRVEDTDGYLLEQASTFHVKPSLPMVRLTEAVSPHLAARRAGTTIDVSKIVEGVARARSSGADAIVVELPGGLFSPVTEEVFAVNLIRRLAPDAVVLVASDRIGVLHDVLAATEAARAHQVDVTHVLLSPVSTSDITSGTNAAELRRFSKVTVLDSAPWGDPEPSSVAALVRDLTRAQ